MHLRNGQSLRRAEFLVHISTDYVFNEEAIHPIALRTRLNRKTPMAGASWQVKQVSVSGAVYAILPRLGSSRLTAQIL